MVERIRILGMFFSFCSDLILMIRNLVKRSGISTWKRTVIMKRYWWRRFLERRMRLAKHQFYHCHFVFSFSSSINFSSFFIGSWSINDFAKVSKLRSMASLFFWLTFTFLICYCILTTFQVVFGIIIFIVIVKWWLNDIRKVCRFPTPYQ